MLSSVRVRSEQSNRVWGPAAAPRGSGVLAAIGLDRAGDGAARALGGLTISAERSSLTREASPLARATAVCSWR